jgi:GH25 family lysozyme M1 (1,4-beta-N-acetylmuramidase)
MDNDYRAHGFYVDWLFTEAGPFESVETGWRHAACLGGDVNAYIGAVRTWLRDVQTTHAYQTGRTMGFCLFTTGGGQVWQYYETRQPELNALADMVKVEWKPGVPAPPPPPPPAEVLGLDVSRWQGAINWDTAYSRGARFVFCKATEHVSWTDPLFAQNVIGAKKVKLITGAYHFYKPTYNPIEQADHFTNTVGGRVDMPLVLDVEDSVGAPPGFADDVRDCLEHIATVTGRRPVLYTSPGFYAGWLASGRLFEVADLWIAHWTALPTPIVPLGFGDWHFWQYTNQGVGAEWGVSSARVDLNRWNGTLEELHEYAHHIEPFPVYASTVNLMSPNGGSNHQWETVKIGRAHV